MSKVIAGIVIGLVLGATGMVLLVRYPQVANLVKSSPADKEQTPAAQAQESFLQSDSNGQTVVKLDPNEQHLIGLEVAPLQAAQAPTEIGGFGRVLDPAPLAALVAEGAAAEATLQASTKEYERVKTLFEQNQNASAKALETAQAAMNKDRVAVESVQWRLGAGWGREIASRQDLQALAASLAARRAALIRVDLPFGERPKAPPVGGRVAPVGAPERAIEAQILGPAPATDPQTQTEGYLLLAQTDALAPGAALTAHLTIPGSARSGVIVPRAAVLHYEGGTFIYLQRDDEMFQRRAVILERPLGNGWFSPTGANDPSGSGSPPAPSRRGELAPLQPQEKVVVVGAQQLLSEELKGRSGPEE